MAGSWYMSPSVWWDEFLILRLIEAITEKPDLRIWLDIGTKEGRVTPGKVRSSKICSSEKDGDRTSICISSKFTTASTAKATGLRAWDPRSNFYIR